MSAKSAKESLRPEEDSLLPKGIQNLTLKCEMLERERARERERAIERERERDRESNLSPLSVESRSLWLNDESKTCVS